MLGWVGSIDAEVKMVLPFGLSEEGPIAHLSWHLGSWLAVQRGNMTNFLFLFPHEII